MAARFLVRYCSIFIAPHFGCVWCCTLADAAFNTSNIYRTFLWCPFKLENKNYNKTITTHSSLFSQGRLAGRGSHNSHTARNMPNSSCTSTSSLISSRQAYRMKRHRLWSYPSFVSRLMNSSTWARVLRFRSSLVPFISRRSASSWWLLHRPTRLARLKNCLSNTSSEACSSAGTIWWTLSIGVAIPSFIHSAHRLSCRFRTKRAVLCHFTLLMALTYRSEWLNRLISLYFRSKASCLLASCIASSNSWFISAPILSGMSTGL